MPKLHAGLDVSDQTTAICVLDSAGKVIFETSVATMPAAIAAALKPYRRALTNVGQETGTKSIWLHKELLRLRFPMVCLDARHAHSVLAAQLNKTDKNDARGLATLLSRGLFTAAYVKSDEAIRIRLLLTTRRTMMRKAIDLQMSMRMSLKMFGGQVEKKARRVSVKKQKGTQDDMLQRVCRTIMRTSDAMMAEVAVLDELAKRMANADPVCRRLMTIPGVGPITALTFRAAVDDPARFKVSRDVAAYFGLTPRRYQSGQMDFYGRISRHGDRSVRAALYSSAASLLNVSKSTWSVRLWGLRLAKKKAFRVAAVACARKLAVVMHRIWVTGEEFEPQGARSKRTSPPRSARPASDPG